MIYVGHGVLEAADKPRFLDRYMLDRSSFAAHLEERRSLYIQIESAVCGNGDALTVDDATVAGADMAMLARELGHEVTLFVNPGQIATADTYWFHRLTLLVDGLGSRVPFDDGEFDCASIAGKVRLRRALKRRLLSIPGESERIRAIAEIGTCLGAQPTGLPEHLRTLTLPELEALRSAGVRLANHGWHHPHYDSLGHDERLDQIRQGREWLNDFHSGSGDGVFACPFGDHDPDDDLLTLAGLWLSANARTPPGLRKGVYNRQEIRLRTLNG